MPTRTPAREGLRAALRDRGTNSVLMNFRAERGGYRLRSYRLTPGNRPLPDDLTDRLRALARTTIDEDLPPRSRQSGKQGTLTWSLETDRFVIGN